MPPDRFAIELVAPTRQFVYRSLAVGEPFWLGKAHHLDLARLVRYRGATHRHDALASVRPQHQEVASASDAVLDYEFLVIAIGAPAVPSIPGALTFDGGSGVWSSSAPLFRTWPPGVLATSSSPCRPTGDGRCRFTSSPC